MFKGCTNGAGTSNRSRPRVCLRGHESKISSQESMYIHEFGLCHHYGDCGDCISVYICSDRSANCSYDRVGMGWRKIEGE